MAVTDLEIPRFAPVRRRAGLAWAREILQLGLVYLGLIALSALILLPLGWMLTVALKPDDVNVFTTPPEWFPTTYFDWENFSRALTNPERPFALYLFNTVWIEVFVVLGSVVSCALVAYPLARMRFRGRNVIFNIIVLTMLIPWQGLMVPQFLMFYKLGWYGTYLPLIVPSFFGTAFFIFLIRQYMRSIPMELDEAARLDGAGPFRIFWSIILPLSKPALAVCAVFTFLATWNDLLGPVIYLNRNDQFTTAVGLAGFISKQNQDFNLLMAANIVTIIPVMVLYFVAQKYLIGGIASVGLKG
ncbi:MAG: carbohydrate ABC transporter permease [Pseudolysinimonas sp.]